MGASVTAISLRRASIVQRVRNVGKSFEETPSCFFFEPSITEALQRDLFPMAPI
jgi:hypothetical protein